MRRTDDVRFHSLDKRLHVVETRVEYVVAVLAGQREMAEDLMDEARTNSRDIGDLRMTIASTESKVLQAIAEHSKEEAITLSKATRTAFWTLVTVMATAAVTFLGYMADKVDHLGIIGHG